MASENTTKRLVISATSSGAGKTTITTAILHYLKEHGSDVHAFKCGPDYIDPMYHESVLGVESKNLDPFFCDEDLLRAGFLDGAGQINIIEGCMGLYDGLGVTRNCSTYTVACALQAPIILVVDGYGMGYSIVATIKGFLALDEARLIKGIILNRVSVSYYSKLAPVIEKETGIKCVGFLPKQKDTFESRHLGLKSPKENNAIEQIKGLSSELIKGLDFDTFLGILSEAGPLHCKKRLEDYVPKCLEGTVIGVAKDEAFSFYYKDNLKALSLAGATLKFFSPIHDEVLPEGLTGLYLGGGYPELYLAELSANKKMLEQLYWAICEGLPTLAECGAFMYLQRSIEGIEMVGLFQDRAIRKSGLVRFGYIEGRFKDYILKGHEFHHFDVTNPGEAFEITKASTGEKYRAMWSYRNCIAGFPHFYFLSDPRFLEEFKG